MPQQAIDQQEKPPPIILAVGVDPVEWNGLEDVKNDVLEPKLEARIDLRPINRDAVVSDIDSMAATDNLPDVMTIDNDTLGILVQRGLVQELTPYLRVAGLPQDSLFERLREKHRIAGQDYSVPFHPNVKLQYYNEDLVSEPPTTWKEWENLARELALKGLGRVAIQAHPGKAAAVTAFEWVKSMRGEPLTLKGPETQEAFKRLWKLAPYLAPESSNIQFDTANNFLSNNKVSMVDNWTYGIKVVMEVYKKKNIKVAPGLRGSVHVLGGDVLAIPTGISKEREIRAIKLIEHLVSKETQRALAEKLFWAPVREDVYNDLSAQEEWKEYFQEIRKVLWNAEMRPITPYWDMVQKVLSNALGKVLKQDPERDKLETDAQIDAHIKDLLSPFIADLEQIPREIEPCVVVEQKTIGAEYCQVAVKSNKSYKDLASEHNCDAATLAMFNGRGESDIVSPKKPEVILVPKGCNIS